MSMNQDEIRYWFDKAFEHLLAGNFGDAAGSFQHILDACNDAYARGIAQRDLEWYCFPLEAMVKKLESTPTPHTFSDLVQADESCGKVDSTDVEYMRSLAKRLAQIATVRKLGADLWMHRTNWENAVQNVLHDQSLPATISEVASEIFRTFSLDDHSSDEIIDLLKEYLGKYPKILSLKNECIFSLANVIDFGANIFHIASSTGKPVALSQTVNSTPWSESVKSQLDIDALNRCLSTHLPEGLVEIANGWWGIPRLFDLANASVDTFFEAGQRILTTRQILCRYLFGDQEPHLHLTEKFIQQQSVNLALNRGLIELGQNRWTRAADVYHAAERAANVLSISRLPKTAHALMIEVGIPVEFENVFVKQLANAPHITRVAPGLWFHWNALPYVVEQSAEALKNSPGLSTSQLLKSIWEESGQFQWDPTFISQLESALGSDDRFMPLAQGNGWTVVPDGNRSNNLAYRVLFQEHRLLKRQEIIQLAKNILHTGSLNFQLEADPRFMMHADGRWSLSNWLIINDWAAQYLFASPLPLLPETIIKNVCTLHEIDATRAIFDPENDPRFVPAPFGKWRCKAPGKILTPDVLEIIVQHASLAEEGLSLNDLIQGATNEFPSAYSDLEKTLLGEERLVYCDGLWYYRPKWFYEITQGDLRQVKSYIRQQGFPVIGRVLAGKCLGRPLCLTNLEEVLSHDPEIENLGSVGWVIHDLQPLSVGRCRALNYAIRSQYVPSIDPTTLEEVEFSSNVSDSSSRTHEITNRIGPIRYIAVTLGFEDVRDGSIVVTAMMRRLLGDSLVLPALRFTDEVGENISCWHDSVHNLLHGFGKWFAERSLTYGDKVRLAPTEETGVFKILLTGERNAQVHNEGLSRSKIQNLREEAQRAKKSYHDLVVDVLQYFGVPIHVDDLWAMVNYRRSARKNYLNVILSRYPYFVSDGHGNWRYDEKEYARMIRDLEAKIQTLERENSLLKSSVTELSARISIESPLQERIESLENQVQELKQHLLDSEQTNSNLLAQHHALEIEAEQLRTRLVEVTRSREMAESSAAKLSSRIELLESDMKSATQRIHQLTDNNAMFEDKIASLESDNRQLDEANVTMQNRLSGTILTTEAKVKNLENELMLRNRKIDELTDCIGMYEQRIALLESENLKLSEQSALTKDQVIAAIQREEQLKGTLGEMEHALGEAKKEAASLRSRVEELTCLLDTTLATKEEIDAQLRQATSKEQSQNQELAKLGEMLASMQMELQVSRNHREELEGNVTTIQMALATADEKYASAEKQNKSLEEQLALAQVELRELGKRLGSISNRYETINQEFVKAMRILDSNLGRVVCWWSRTTGLDLPARAPQD